MNTSSNAPKTNQSKRAIADLAPKADTEVRGGVLRSPAVSEIVVTKDQDCSSTN